MKKLCLLLCAAGCFSLLLFVPRDHYQRELAEKILRFHVVANSNSVKDQQLKLLVRNDVVNYLSDKLTDCRTLADALAVLEQEQKAIERVAGQSVAAAGYDYDVTVAVRERYFPVKMYGEMTFPRGYYRALTVDIGAAAGRNWWCVLFPNLCFTDAVSAYVPADSKRLLARELEKNTYESLYEGEKVQIRFKICEILDDLF